MRFSNKELKDLFGAWFLISIAFAILLSGGLNIFSSLNAFLISFLLSALTVGLAFVFHELMHKFIAQKYGLWAEFRAFYPMLFLAVVISFFGFIIAAPGAVMIKGRYLSKDRNGRISLAGPMTNIILALIFLLLLFFTNVQGIISLFFSYGLTINSLLALFNILPVPGFDGRKVYEWNKAVYTVTALFALGLFLISFIF
jgi:Zn-dependent protease